MSIGKFIKEQRLGKGMTQEDLAVKTDVSTRTIQRIENDEVDARAYTLQNIATALEIDFAVLNAFNYRVPEKEHQEYSNKHIWLPLLHLSGLFNLLIPPLIIWLIKREKINEIQQHGIAVLNFQLSMLLYQVICGLFLMLLIHDMAFVPFITMVLLILFSLGSVLVNTLKVFNGQPYKYSFSINILKSN